MPVVIVDTDVVSYLFKEDTRGGLYEPHLAGVLASISFMTLAELEHWTITRNWVCGGTVSCCGSSKAALW